MKTVAFGRDAVQVSEIGLGCWQLGDRWGEVKLEAAESILLEALDNGISLFDTADVYGDGRSETIIGDVLKSQKDRVFIATKVGRSSDLFPDRYSRQGLRDCIEGSLKRLRRESLDLVQLHCLPEVVLKQGGVFEWLRELTKEGKIQRFGASVESISEAETCLRLAPDLYSLQIILNLFRQKPVTALLPAAKAANVAIIARLPLASGLLTGKLNLASRFQQTDHRWFNRDGQKFNVGETFAGLPFEKGVQLVGKLQDLVPDGYTMTQLALRWLLDHESVSVIIPGASKPGQTSDNAAISGLAPLSPELHQKLDQFYEQQVHSHIRGPY